MTSEQHEVVAVVQKVLPGHHGRFAVATSDSFIGSITFALDASVWGEGSEPTEGTWVVLSELTRKQAGWRALAARYFRPTDEARIAQRAVRERGAIVP